MIDVISRKEAKTNGLSRYFTGKPCKRGHIAERYVSGWACTECDKEWRENNKDKIAEYQKEYQKEYYENNKDKISEYYKEYYEMNKDKILERIKEWRENNKELDGIRTANRRARKRTAEGNYTKDDVEHILETQRYICANLECNADLNKGYHVDHIIPLVRGGSNWPDNLQCLCPTCNLSKGAKDPIEWANINGRLF